MHKFYIFKSLAFLLCLFILSSQAYSQRSTYLSPTKNGDIRIIEGDTTVFILDGYKAGSIQWMMSLDGVSWTVIDQATTDSLQTIPQEQTFYRAIIVDGTCDPYYSEVYSVVPVAKDEAVVEISGAFLPDKYLDLLEDEIISYSESEDYEEIIEDLLGVTIALYDTISLYYSLDEFKQAISQFQSDFYFPDKSDPGCDIVSLGLGYSKGVVMNQGVSTGFGEAVAAEMGRTGGGGIAYVYDFMNLTSQAYILSYCGSGITAEAVLETAMSSGLGFTGYISWLMGIPFSPTPGKNLLAGASKTTPSYGLSIVTGTKLGVDVSQAYGKKIEVDYECETIQNLSDCPSLVSLPIIPERVKEYVFTGGMDTTNGMGAALTTLLATSNIGTCRIGIDDGFLDYRETTRGTKRMAALRMAANLLSSFPLEGIQAERSPADMIAAAAAITYAFNDLEECHNWDQPTVVTQEDVEVIDASTGTYKAGGVLMSDGGSEILDKGIALSISLERPPSYSMHFSSHVKTEAFYAVLENLSYEQPYVLAAYAENELGIAYGNEIDFVTLDDGSPPVVEFTATPTSGNAPLEVDFADHSTNDPTGWLWDFGDGNTSDQQNPLHTYVDPGLYTVTLTATNPYGSDTMMKPGHIEVEKDITIISGTFTDSRDDKTYRWVQLGQQIWMAENLNYFAAGGFCYDENSTNCDYYGRLYNWEIATNGALPSNTNPSGVQGICPPGWHLPSKAEWEQLIDFLFDEYGILNTWTVEGTGNALKSCRQVNSPLGGDCNTMSHPRWDEDSVQFGTDIFGFSALPAGRRWYGDVGYYDELGNRVFWWTTTKVSPLSNSKNYATILKIYGSAVILSMWKAHYLSIRCVKDAE